MEGYVRNGDGYTTRDFSKILVVNIDFEDFGFSVSVVGYKIDVGNTCRNKTTKPFVKHDGEPPQRITLDLAVSFQTHIHDEGVVFVEFAVEGAREVMNFCCKKGTFSEGNWFVLTFLVGGEVIVVNGKVDGIFSQLGV